MYASLFLHIQFWRKYVAFILYFLKVLNLRELRQVLSSRQVKFF